MNTKKNYALPIAMMFALFFMIAFVTGLQNPMGVIVKNQFGASNLLSQLGNLANFIAYAFMGIPAGIMLQKIGYKKTALSAVIIGFVGVGVTFLSGQVESFSVYILGAFISGFSMCMLNTVVNPMLNTLGGEGKTGNQLLQFGGTLNSIGATIIPVLVGYLMGTNEATRTIAKANPAIFLAMGVFVLVFLVLFFMNIPEPHIISEEKAKEKHSHSALSFRHFKLGMIAIFIYVGVEVGIANISNLFMTTYTPEQIDSIKKEYAKQQSDTAYFQQLVAEEKASPDNESKIIKKEIYEKACDTKVSGLGMPASTAGSVVGTYWFLMLIGRFTGGSLGSKFSSKTMLTFVTSFGLILVLLAIFSPVTTTVMMPVFKSNISFGLAEVPISIMFLILCGLCTSVMWGSIFNLATAGLGKYTAAASGLFMVMVCGGGILPAFQGFVADYTSYMASYWVVLAGIAYMLYFALAGSKNVNTDINVEVKA
jgi:FHS family L-fucose permease-like MFS transporter